MAKPAKLIALTALAFAFTLAQAETAEAEARFRLKSPLTLPAWSTTSKAAGKQALFIVDPATGALSQAHTPGQARLPSLFNNKCAIVVEYSNGSAVQEPGTSLKKYDAVTFPWPPLKSASVPLLRKW